LTADAASAWDQLTDQPSPADLFYELISQARAATYSLHSGLVMRWSVPESRSHDDLLNALVLCVQADPLTPRRVATGRTSLRSAS
jgi:hypothetical protein